MFLALLQVCRQEVTLVLSQPTVSHLCSITKTIPSVYELHVYCTCLLVLDYCSANQAGQMKLNEIK